ncbi:COG1361 S-layer family protein [Candidatus Woesearchaeota archaeon]|nr:COG1361 S-layer family protein [Candidatus Woesearchaeota archaeon]
MNRTILIEMITMILAMLAVPSLALNTLVADNADLSTTLLRYTPNPAEPGDVVDVYILLNNDGSVTARNVIFEMADSYPFSVEDASKRIINIPAVPGQEEYLLKYRVRINKNAEEGTSYLKVNYRIDGAQTSKSDQLSIDILTNDASIEISRIEISPESVSPGKEATIKLYLKNLADSKLRDLTVTIDTTRTLGSTTSELPFAHMTSSKERHFPELTADETVVAEYRIVVEPDAVSDVYKLPITLTYSDETGNDYTKNDEIGLVINADIDLDAYIDSVEPCCIEQEGQMIIRLVNRGLSEIKLLTAEISDESDDYELFSPSNRVYVGNIDSDDYETVTYDIQAMKKEFTVALKVDYMDSLNNPKSEIFQLPVKLNPQNSQSSTGTVWFVVILVVIIVAFVWWRRRKKKSKRRQG